MTDKLVPKGLRNQEVERDCSRRPPIPYIPAEDKIGEQVNKVAGSWVFKLQLPNSTKVNQTQWDVGNKETFIIHVMNALSYCDRKGFFKVYKEAESAFAKAVSEAKMTKTVVDELAKDAKQGEKG